MVCWGELHTEKQKVAEEVWEPPVEIENSEAETEEAENEMCIRDRDRNTKEVEAESVAFTVCQHFGIDTSDYSFGYIAGWSSGRNMKELKSSLDTIRKTASELITGIEGAMQELQDVYKRQGFYHAG